MRSSQCVEHRDQAAIDRFENRGCGCFCSSTKHRTRALLGHDKECSEYTPLVVITSTYASARSLRDSLCIRTGRLPTGRDRAGRTRLGPLMLRTVLLPLFLDRISGQGRARIGPAPAEVLHRPRIPPPYTPGEDPGGIRRAFRRRSPGPGLPDRSGGADQRRTRSTFARSAGTDRRAQIA